MFSIGYILLLLTGFFLYTLLFRRRPKNFPPGPSGYPIVGNVFQLGHEKHKTFMELGQKYGDIIGLQLGSASVVVLNNHKDIREAFNESALTGRPGFGLVESRNRGGPRGIIVNEGNSWQEQRRFALRHLRDFGFGKKSMEVLVMDEVRELIENIVKCKGAPISTQNRFNGAVLNALWSIMTGKRYSHDDPKLMEFFVSITEIISRPSLIVMFAQFFPSLLALPKYLPSLFPDQIKGFVDPLYAFFDEIVKEHKETHQPGFPRDFIDVYLDTMKDTNDPQSSFYGEEGEKSLSVVILDLFVAGAETTSSTLSWVCLLLALHPEVQEKLHKEIGKVVETSRHVSLTDRNELNYLEVTIMEVMRYSALVPLGVAHRAMEDTTFHGYNIPKDTIIMPNTYAASRDNGIWKDPENFRPERFLSPDGKQIVRKEAFIPFSIGKRICLGQSLAVDELFLFVGNLVQRFEMKTVGNVEKPYGKEAFMLMVPKPHELRLIDRLR